jgi:hypothetical protein
MSPAFERREPARRPRTAHTVQDRRRPQGDVRASSSGRVIAARRWGGRGSGAVKATGYPRRGPYRWKAPQVIAKRRPSRVGVDRGLGSLLTNQHAREGGRTGAEEEEATGVSEVRSRRAPWEENAHARRPEQTGNTEDNAFERRIRRSDAGVVKRPRPWSRRAEGLQSPRGSLEPKGP